jgi:hypothetical protein
VNKTTGLSSSVACLEGFANNKHASLLQRDVIMLTQ